MKIYLRQYKKLLKQIKESYETIWNAGHLIPGIYLYELKTGQNKKVIKMILMQP